MIGRTLIHPLPGLRAGSGCIGSDQLKPRVPAAEPGEHPLPPEFGPAVPNGCRCTMSAPQKQPTAPNYFRPPLGCCRQPEIRFVLAGSRPPTPLCWMMLPPDSPRRLRSFPPTGPAKNDQERRPKANYVHGAEQRLSKRAMHRRVLLNKASGPEISEFRDLNVPLLPQTHGMRWGASPNLFQWVLG